MTSPPCHIQDLILKELADGEKRVLSLTVAVRRVMQQSRVFKGDLQASVQASLRKLVASHDVVESDGIYSLARAKR